MGIIYNNNVKESKIYEAYGFTVYGKINEYEWSIYNYRRENALITIRIIDESGNDIFSMYMGNNCILQCRIDDTMDNFLWWIAEEHPDSYTIEKQVYSSLCSNNCLFNNSIQQRKVKRRREEERKEAEKENFKIWMQNEVEKVPDFQKEIIDSIFFAIYGQQNTWNYTLAVCINNYNNPLCKEEVIARLHNNNKASIKIFECLTGLKLPKGYKERKAYLDSISVLDFKEAVDYKPRKKREEKEIQKEEFYINERTSEGQKWTKVIAEPFTKYGVDMFIRYSNGSFSISLAEAGMKVCDGRTKTECINKLKKFVDDRGKETFLQMVKDATEKMYKATGINPRYKEVATI